MLRVLILANLLVASCRPAAPDVPLAASDLAVSVPVDVVHVLPAADYEQPLGAPVKMWPLEVATNGRWVAACVVRNAAEVGSSYLFRGGGEGAPYDDLIAISSDDRWLVLRRAHEVVLVDDAQGVERTLWHADISDLGGFRRAAFDANSQYLVYLTGPSKLAVRSLTNQHEQTLEVPGAADDHVYRVIAEPRGSWIRIVVAHGERNPMRRFEGPPPEGPIKPWPRCNNVERHDWFAGIEATQYWLDVRTGVLERGDGVLGRIGDVTIQRRKDQSIVVNGVELIPSSCQADVISVSVDPPLRVVATCAASGQRVPMVLFGPGAPGVLPVKIARPYMRPIGLATSRYSCDATTACVTLTDGTRVTPPGIFEAMGGDKLIEFFGDKLVLLDPANGHATPIPGGLGDVSFPSGSMITVGYYVIDLSRGQILGRLPSRPRAVDRRGRGLILADEDNELGPMRWVSPQPD